jgi:hypothetical protein
VCDARAKDCALTQMAAFVDGETTAVLKATTQIWGRLLVWREGS